MTPITIGLAEAGGINTFLVVGATIGGAMFGDNLSMISDTTIAATRTQGVEMKELGIATMVSLTDMATANNTVSILINGSVAKEISEEYQIDPKRTASLLDIFSCVWQGLLPYGAQILFACALITNLDSPFQVISMCWYQYLLAAFAILSTLIAGKRGGAKTPKQQVK